MLSARTPDSAESGLARFGRLALAVPLGFIGVTHFTSPEFYDRMVPPILGNARPYTLVSGAAEIGLAALLMRRRTAWVGGWALAAFFVAVFPANIYDAFNRPTTGRWVRLPFQIPFIWWAVAVARSAPVPEWAAKRGWGSES